ncbi:methyl-accepting chemotaxis protein [Gemmata sp. JC673]|uniref:Methyl-accepting chemotaxis protein n=1 Tax=Gemmata algarum TaxID=2975278 RepID=A0ABU5EUS6_9BACT|nr:methyl-accepting chemotaxis protein [Gemmata algarum]MDY3559053.1 methyl-accepting chemotaxis protein [Gemmata algarum]
MSNSHRGMLNSISISHLLAGGFLLLAAICLVEVVCGLTVASDINKSQESSNNDLIPSICALTDARGKGVNNIQRAQRTLIMATRSKNESVQRQAREDLARAWKELQTAMTWYELLPMSDRERQLWGDFRAGLEEFRQHYTATTGALDAGDVDRAEGLCLDPAPGVRLNNSLNELIDVHYSAAKEHTVRAREQYQAARSRLVAAAAVAVLAALGLAAFFYYQIVPPLAANVRVLQAVAAGDYGQRVSVTTANEFGQMAAALNVACDTLQANMTRMAQLGALVEQSPLNVMFADRDCTIRYANRATVQTLRRLEQYLPVKADGLVGKSIDIFHKRPEHQRRLLADPSTVPPKTLIQVGPETLELCVSPVFDQERAHLGTMVSWSIVTERIALEKQVKESTERERAAAAELEHKMSSIMAVVSALADGNFTSSVPDLGTDDVGRMAQELNKAIVSVRTALQGVREVAEQLADASGQLSAASEEISTGAQQQAGSLEETASTLQEITSTVRRSADSAQQARQLASGSKEVAEKGGSVVSSAVGAMGEINESSKKIAEIITTIDEIAFQTNLLALNAAVEAARAGEQGRGFAVVATEVRNLAQRSATAAKEIKSLIQDSVKKVDTGTELVNKSGDTLAEIVTSVKRVTDIVTEIAAASREQSTGIEQVNKAVAQMDTVTQRNASQTEEMSATAQTLTDQAAQLRDLVGRFTLDGAAPGAGRSSAPAARSRTAPARKSGGANGRAAVHSR